MLGAISLGPTHGFAVAAELSPQGGLGKVWTLPKALVYSQIRKLSALGLIEPAGRQPSQSGPARTILVATPLGRSALDSWLVCPVDHVRDVRSSLLLKLALLERIGRDPGPLLAAQRERLAPQIRALDRNRQAAQGFDRVLAEWRYSSSEATLRFLDAISEGGS